MVDNKPNLFLGKYVEHDLYGNPIYGSPEAILLTKVHKPKSQYVQMDKIGENIYKFVFNDKDLRQYFVDVCYMYDLTPYIDKLKDDHKTVMLENPTDDNLYCSLEPSYPKEKFIEEHLIPQYMTKITKFSRHRMASRFVSLNYEVILKEVDLKRKQYFERGLYALEHTNYQDVLDKEYDGKWPD